MAQEIGIEGKATKPKSGGYLCFESCRQGEAGSL